MTSTQMDAKSAVSDAIAFHNRLNVLTGVNLKLFTFASLVSLVLLVSKIAGFISISYLAVFAPIAVSFAIGTIFFIFAVIVAVATKAGR